MTIATCICYGLTVLVGILIFVDLWLSFTGQQLITDAVREENKATGWLVAGAYLVLGFHFFILPYALQLWHKFIG